MRARALTTLFTAILAAAAPLPGTRSLRVVELIVVGLLGEGILRTLKRRNDLILRVPLGIQERLGLLCRAKDHIVRHVRSTRGVAKAAATMGALGLGRAALGLGRATATTNATILSYKLRELSECRVELANICGGVHSVREQLAELARVIGGAAHHITATTHVAACIASATTASPPRSTTPPV